VYTYEDFIHTVLELDFIWTVYVPDDMPPSVQANVVLRHLNDHGLTDCSFMIMLNKALFSEPETAHMY
jgi:hypothetical protein